MTDPIQLTPDAVNGYAVQVDDHAGHVVTVSIPPALASAAMSQNTGQATQALHVITQMIGEAMGRELADMSGKTHAGTNALVAQDEHSGRKLGAIGEGVDLAGAGTFLNAVLSPLNAAEQTGGQVISGGSQAVLGLGGQAISGLGNVVGQVTGSVTKNANVGGVPAVDINHDDQKSSGATRPMSGGVPLSQPAPGGSPLFGGRDNIPKRDGEQHDAVVPAAGIGGGAMPFRPPTDAGGSSKVTTVTKRVVTERDSEDASDKISS